jgi:hypothetical protein
MWDFCRLEFEPSSDVYIVDMFQKAFDLTLDKTRGKSVCQQEKGLMQPVVPLVATRLMVALV